MRDTLIPILFFLFMVINIYLDKTKRKKRRQQQRAEQKPEPLPDAATEKKQPADLAAEFERRLKKTTAEAEAAKQKQRDRIVTDGGRVHRDDEAVVHDNTGRVRRDDGKIVYDSGRIHHDGEAPHDNSGVIHRDGEAPHDNSGRIHRDNESFAHDKSKVYYDPRGDYSYDEAKMNAAAAAFNAYYAKAQEPAPKQRVKLKHTALVNGFIMSEVLNKPRALQPYGDDCH